MSDKLILASIVAAVGQGYGGTVNNPNKVAQAILDAGFKLRDPELEARVEKLERWTQGEF